MNSETQAYAAQHSMDQAVLLFLDFAAAFPSLCRHWIFAVLTAMGLPKCVIKALANLHANNHHIHRYGSKVVYAFLIMTGVRQGCPASATVFAWCSHPVLLYIQKSAPINTHQKGYENDIYILLQNLWRDLGPIWSALAVIARATNLHVNIQKTFLVPLWRQGLDIIKKRFNCRWPELEKIVIVDYAKYLGFMIGPSAVGESWVEPKCKFIKRAGEAAKLGGGTCISINALNIYGYPTLSHVAQLKLPTKELEVAARHANRLAMQGSYRWLPDILMGTTNAYLDCGAQPNLLCDYCFAIRARVIAANILDWKSDCDIIEKLGRKSARIDGRTLNELAGDNKQRDNLPCIVLRNTAIEAKKLGLLRLDEGQWSTTDMTSPFTGKKMTSKQTWLEQQLLAKKFGTPSAHYLAIVQKLNERTRRFAMDNGDGSVESFRTLH